jgi:hypothetical protein
MGAAQTLYGKNGGFLVTRGRPRIGVLNGRVFVVGRGEAIECADQAAAKAKLDELLAGEKARFVAKRAKVLAVERAEVAAAVAPSADARGLAVGATVRFAMVPGGPRETVGRIAEIGARSLAVTDARADTYRRAPADVEPV